MEIDKSLMSGSTTMLILNLLEKKDMYGYDMIDSLKKSSKDTFMLKAGTLYPLLHNLEKKGMVIAYEGKSEKGRIRKYYKITASGKGLLKDKEKEWSLFTNTINNILHGGTYCEPT